MLEFLFGTLFGYMTGMLLGYFVCKIDREIKNDRG